MNEILKWVLGFLGAILMGMGTWGLTTVLAVKEQSTIHGLKIEGIEKTVDDIADNIKTLKVGPSESLDTNELANKIYLKIMNLDEAIQKKGK